MIKEVHVAVANDLPKRVKFPGAILVASALMLGGLGVSEWLKPSRVMADELRPVVMKRLLLDPMHRIKPAQAMLYLRGAMIYRTLTNYML